MARSIECRILEEKDFEEVWDIILEIYCTSESTITFYELSAEDIRDLLQKSVQDSISQRVSVGAFDKETNQLVGIVLSHLGRLHKRTFNEEEQPLSRQIRQQKAIAKYFLGDDPPATFGTREYLRPFVLCSHPDYNREDIETELCKKCEAIASKEGCKKIVTIVSSLHTRKSLKKFKYVTEKTLRASDYVDPITETMIFEDLPREPDTNITLEVKYL